METSSSAERKAEALQAARTLRALKFARSCALASTWADNKRSILAREREIVRPDASRTQSQVPTTKRRESIGPGSILRTSCHGMPAPVLQPDRKPLQPSSTLKPSVPVPEPGRSNPSSLGPIRTQSTSNRMVEGVVHVGRQVYIVERATKVTISTVRRVVSVPPVGTRERELLQPYLVPRKREGVVEMKRSSGEGVKDKVKIEEEGEVNHRLGMRDEKAFIPTSIQSPSTLTFRFPDLSARRTLRQTPPPPPQTPSPCRRSSLAAPYERVLRDTVPDPPDLQHSTKPALPQRAPLCWRRGKRVHPLALF